MRERAGVKWLVTKCHIEATKNSSRKDKFELDGQGTSIMTSDTSQGVEETSEGVADKQSICRMENEEVRVKRVRRLGIKQIKISFRIDEANHADNCDAVLKLCHTHNDTRKS